MATLLTPAKFGEVLGMAPGDVPVYSCDYKSALPSDFPDRDSYRSEINSVLLGFKWQCVELARRWLYVNYGYIFEDVAMAYDIFNLRHVIDVERLQRRPLHSFRNGSKRPPEYGCMLIWDEGGDFEVTGHVAIVIEVTSNSVRFVEQNVDNLKWPTGQNYSRELTITIDQTGGYWIEPQYHGAAILGWVIQTDDATHAAELKPADLSLFDIKERKLRQGTPHNRHWIDIKSLSARSYVKVSGHRLVSPPNDPYVYYTMSESARKELRRATTELHLLFLHATDFVLHRPDYFERFNLPEHIRPRIVKSWNNRRNEAITGRFDFSVSDRGLKLLEYNADSASCYFEAGYLQGLWAKVFGCNEGEDAGKDLAASLKRAWKNSEASGILHIMHDTDPEETYHAAYMLELMEDAALQVKMISGVEGLSWKNGDVVDPDGDKIDQVWKTWAWESALDQIRQELEETSNHIPLDSSTKPRLVDVLLRPNVMVYEPLWTLVTSNKALLPVIYELHPDHPYLLRAEFDLTDDLRSMGYVQKPIVGRQGENIVIVDKKDELSMKTKGRFSNQSQVYQQLFTLPCVNERYVQVCTFSVAGRYAGTCVRVDSSPIITGKSDVFPLRFVPDDQF